MNPRVLFSFNGRSGRLQWWGVTVSLLIVATMIDVLMDLPATEVFAAIVGIPFIVLMFWLLTAVSVRRWHDLGKSGWWVFIHAVPVVGPFIAIGANGFVGGEPEQNRYGPPLQKAPGDAQQV
ncbi:MULTISPECIES: DUF805 domain-containing protein [unclassified Paraburkholderia]|uniref:DUF805 domain-containing protein n=1 Tax=unclassified Paraburkholderia TaxID=2615204 RepID=UPI002AB2BA95|nr:MULTISPECIES: DUF805 domain-containing protein [unclassified Paraburkholderia]